MTDLYIITPSQFLLRNIFNYRVKLKTINDNIYYKIKINDKINYVFCEFTEKTIDEYLLSFRILSERIDVETIYFYLSNEYKDFDLKIKERIFTMFDSNIQFERLDNCLDNIQIPNYTVYKIIFINGRLKFKNNNVCNIC